MAATITIQHLIPFMHAHSYMHTACMATVHVVIHVKCAVSKADTFYYGITHTMQRFAQEI